MSPCLCAPSMEGLRHTSFSMMQTQSCPSARLRCGAASSWCSPSCRGPEHPTKASRGRGDAAPHRPGPFLHCRESQLCGEVVPGLQGAPLPSFIPSAFVVCILLTSALWDSLHNLVLRVSRLHLSSISQLRGKWLNVPGRGRDADTETAVE